MKSTKYAFGRALLILAALFAVTFGMTGCSQDADTEYVDVYQYVLPYDGTTLTGEWEDNYTSSNSYLEDGSANAWNSGIAGKFDFKVEADAIYSSSYGKQTGTVYQRKVTSTSGYFYYQISDTTNFSYSSKAASSYENKWYGVYYSNLTDNSVKLCDACSPTYLTDYGCFDTLEDAVKGLNASYFSYMADFTKVTD